MPDNPKKQYMAVWLWLFRFSATKSPSLLIKVHALLKTSSPRTPRIPKMTFTMGSMGVFESVFPGHWNQTGAYVRDFNLVFTGPLERCKPLVSLLWCCVRIRAPKNHQSDNERNIAPGTAWPRKSPIILKTYTLEAPVSEGRPHLACDKIYRHRTMLWPTTI